MTFVQLFDIIFECSNIFQVQVVYGPWSKIYLNIDFFSNSLGTLARKGTKRIQEANWPPCSASCSPKISCLSCKSVKLILSRFWRSRWLHDNRMNLLNWSLTAKSLLAETTSDYRSVFYLNVPIDARNRIDIISHNQSDIYTTRTHILANESRRHWSVFRSPVEAGV